MSETVSSLVAVTEKKSHKPGSCTAVFFQLFHWNRRFARKKKMLTQAGTNLASKKFGSDDKLPKFPLIADKSIVVPDSGQNHGMLTPGLVARLMGLDSMPAVQRDKLKIPSSLETESDSVSDNDCLSGSPAGNSEDLGSKHELRPQKLQKTESCRRYAVTGFGAEAAPFRNVLSRSKKHHQKFASPVKSSMSLSGRHASTLIDAATRILEPGLKSRNRAKFVLHDCSRRPHTLTKTVKTEATKASTDSLLESSYFTDVSKSFSRGDNLLDSVNSRQNLVEQPPNSHYINHSSKGLSRIRPRSPMPSFESEKEKVLKKDQEKFTAFAAQAMHNAPSYTEVISHGMASQRDAQTRWQLTSQQSKSQQGLSCLKSNQKFPTQNKVSAVRDRISARSKLSNFPRSNQSRYTIGLNRCSSDGGQLHLPTEVDVCEYETERHTRDLTDNCVPSVRKRSLKVIRTGEGSGFVRSGNQIHMKSDAMIEKIIGGNVQSRVCIGNKFACELESNKAAGRVNVHNDVISFIFSSPMKQKVEIPEETSDMVEAVFSSNNITGHTSYEKNLLLTGDSLALGTLVEEKLKELINHEIDELAFGSTPSERTSSIIIQELISALNSERPLYPNDLAVRPCGKNATSYSGLTPNVQLKFQPKPKRIRDLQSYSNDSSNSLSPVSVLEVPISCGSDLFSFTDYTSVYKHHDGSVGLCCIKPQHSETYSDPAISLSKGRPGLELVTELLNRTSELLCRVDNICSRLEGSKLDYAKEVILNTELLFGSSMQHDYDVNKRFFISCFLPDELDTLASVLCTSCSSFARFNTKRTSLQGLLFDCIIEYMDMRYGPCFKYGNKTPRNKLLCVSAEMLTNEIVKEIISWEGLPSLITDEHIEKEMSCCLERCLENELFETGAAIDEDIFHVLVDEMLIDFTQAKSDSSFNVM